MVDTRSFINKLIDEYGYEEFIGVPCSNLKSIINYTSNLGIYTKATNEGDAVAYAAGKAMSGKKVAVLMQNSGITNAMSPMTSLLHTFSIPLLFIVGNRGVGPDEPQHELMGRITPNLLSMCGFEVLNITTDEIDPSLKRLDNSSNSVAILINKGSMDKVDLEIDESRELATITRSDILKVIMGKIDKDTLVVSSTGFVSREIYDKYDFPNNFYMVGSMGCAISIATGLASANPDKKVICVDGDGAVMMRPSGLYLASEVSPMNLIHIIIDNGTYESTGGQYTCANVCELSNSVNAIYGYSGEFELHERVSSLPTFIEVFEKALHNEYNITPQSIVVWTVSSNDNSNLGRPKHTMPEIRERFSKFLKGDNHE